MYFWDTTLGPAESLVNDLFRLRRGFQIGVFGLLGGGRGQRVGQTVERGIVLTIGALDRLLDSMISRNQDRIGGAHPGVTGGIGCALPIREPLPQTVAVAKNRGQRLRIPAAPAAP